MEKYSDFESSMVSELAFEPETKTVYVTFKKQGAPGATWRYWPVERADFEIIHTSESVGKAVNKYLKTGGIYNSEKVLG